MEPKDSYNHQSFGQCDIGVPDFFLVARVGTQAPHFTLGGLDGARVSLADFIGKKHVLLEFGSITCPSFVGGVPQLTQLYLEYQPKGFEFCIIYVREVHPGGNFPHHESFEQKLSHARKLRELEGVKIPILVDDLLGTTHRAYGLLANMVYVIDREGVIVYKSNWTDARELEGMCESLVRLDDMKAREVPVIRSAFSERLHWIPVDPEHREQIHRGSGERGERFP